MTKHDFIAELRTRLSEFPRQEVEERLDFYGEMIDDRIEDGMTEEEAVSSIGSVDEILSQIADDIPLSKIAKEKIKPKRRLRAWEIVLLGLGAPIWLTLLISAVSVVVSLYVSLWVVIASLWAVFGAVAAVGPTGVVVGTGLLLNGNALPGIALIGAGLACAGVAILLFFGCSAATDGVVWLTKKVAFGIKRIFIKKEEA